MPLSPQQTASIAAALSPVRLGTYLNATGFGAGATALDIYVWNALASGALFSSLHICEVVVRNAVSHALDLKYGTNWPWDSGFERTLNAWSRAELQRARGRIRLGSPGKVVAELKFAFWCKMFTAGQDQHIWNAFLHTVFPFTPYPLSVAGARTQLYEDMEALRLIRNRIAHHESIINYPLAVCQSRVIRLINLRCEETQQWHALWETLSAVLAARP
ncbi:hypothetical protein OX459_00220 [Janthinobacterium sp. SUN026]|uniref:hypothetical protein n=1 Tax=Janthinobacterium sp. SUN026 TaxID=3002438 RepID=UPI0025B1DD2F|nr:hypothetical protein [Janthinobacterium sp. SUN026]MDN2669810.1 hypothetical protein [Janthinobacterium sp. SUN026]